MVGAADPMMAFPAGTTFTPYSVLRKSCGEGQVVLFHRREFTTDAEPRCFGSLWTSYTNRSIYV